MVPAEPRLPKSIIINAKSIILKAEFIVSKNDLIVYHDCKVAAFQAGVNERDFPRGGDLLYYKINTFQSEIRIPQ